MKCLICKGNVTKDEDGDAVCIQCAKYQPCPTCHTLRMSFRSCFSRSISKFFSLEPRDVTRPSYVTPR